MKTDTNKGKVQGERVKPDRKTGKKPSPAGIRDAALLNKVIKKIKEL